MTLHDRRSTFPSLSLSSVYRVTHRGGRHRYLRAQRQRGDRNYLCCRFPYVLRPLYLLPFTAWNDTAAPVRMTARRDDNVRKTAFSSPLEALRARRISEGARYTSFKLGTQTNAPSTLFVQRKLQRYLPILVKTISIQVCSHRIIVLCVLRLSIMTRGHMIDSDENY